MQAVGDNGFAPTGAAVHPETGDLYVSLGGRGTRGAVYRIRYPAGLKSSRKDAEHWRSAGALTGARNSAETAAAGHGN